MNPKVPTTVGYGAIDEVTTDKDTKQEDRCKGNGGDDDDAGSCSIPNNNRLDRLHQLIVTIHHYQVLQTQKTLLLAYMFLILIYIGLNVGLLCANFVAQDYIEAHYFLPFHLFAFWGGFFFTAVEAVILISTGGVVCAWPATDKENDTENDNDTTQKDAATVAATVAAAAATTSTNNNSLWPTFLIFINVMGTFATALLFTLDPEQYEVVTHYMEYILQILISAVNWIFVHHLTTTTTTTTTTSALHGGRIGGGRGGRRSSNNALLLRHYEIGAASVIVALSIVTVFLYSGILPMGTVEPERAGHFAEFVNEIGNGLFAFLYATVSYMDATTTTAAAAAAAHPYCDEQQQQQQQQQQHYYSTLV
jgi:hypothetical protein